MAAVACKYKQFIRTILPTAIHRSLSIKSGPFIPQRDLTFFDIDNKTGIATISFNNPPVNAFGIELLTEMKSNLDEAEKNNVRGLILTSSLDNIFSAGFDVAQIHTSNREYLTELMSMGQDVTETLHSFPFPTAALINGHALAGGCVYASCCEYRVMMPNYRMGAIEVAVGIVPPDWVEKCILEVLDKRTAELALTQAKQFQTEEALKVGFIDEVIRDKAEGFVKCQKFIESFKGVNSTARILTKRKLRFNLFPDKEASLKAFVDELLQPQVQETIGNYLSSLRIKKIKNKT